MSLGLADREILRIYQEIISGSGKDWMVLSYVGTTNDLRVQNSGDGGLEEILEEFMDSRYTWMLLVTILLRLTVAAGCSMALCASRTQMYVGTHLQFISIT